MDDTLKKQILTSMAPAVVPVTRFAIRNHFEEQRIQRQEQHEIRLAEKQTDAMSDALGEEISIPEATPDHERQGEGTGAGSGWDEGHSEHDGAAAPADDGDDAHAESPQPLEDAIRLADDLDTTLSVTAETEDCSFCQDVVEELRNEPVEVQREGLRELREVKRLMDEEVTTSEIKESMDDMDTVPRMLL
jgi:hypothetical protein